MSGFRDVAWRILEATALKLNRTGVNWFKVIRLGHVAHIVFCAWVSITPYMLSLQ